MRGEKGEWERDGGELSGQMDSVVHGMEVCVCGVCQLCLLSHCMAQWCQLLG